MLLKIKNLVEVQKGASQWTLTHQGVSYVIVPGKWHETTIAALTALWADERLSGVSLAIALGFFTHDGQPGKNSIVGKAHRLNLPARPSPIRDSANAATRRPLCVAPNVSTLPPLSSEAAQKLPALEGSPTKGGQNGTASLTTAPVQNGNARLASHQTRAVPPIPASAHTELNKDVAPETETAEKKVPPPLIDSGDARFEQDGFCTRMEQVPASRRWLRCTGGIAGRRSSFCGSCSSGTDGASKLYIPVRRRRGGETPVHMIRTIDSRDPR